MCFYLWLVVFHFGKSFNCFSSVALFPRLAFLSSFSGVFAAAFWVTKILEVMKCSPLPPQTKRRPAAKFSSPLGLVYKLCRQGVGLGAKIAPTFFGWCLGFNYIKVPRKPGGEKLLANYHQP